jgi:hypothetical protein
MGPWDTEPEKRDQHARDVFSSELKGLGEPTMLGARQGESYRLMMELDGWRRVAIRAEPGSIHAASIERLPSKSVQERADASAGQVEFGPRGCQTRALSASEWSGICDCFQKTSFWAAPTGRPPWHMFDSTSSIIEARQQERYHFVVRMGGSSSPDPQEEAFMSCARLLIKLSGLGDRL